MTEINVRWKVRTLGLAPVVSHVAHRDVPTMFLRDDAAITADIEHWVPPT
ncbi:hypothetical protein [Amycolatopsis sp.]|nr:hypothetical protein [Amycolatopsis sp.]HVV12088.1 hypothetical protein [Amycolatopsis sp.]